MIQNFKYSKSQLYRRAKAFPKQFVQIQTKHAEMQTAGFLSQEQPLRNNIIQEQRFAVGVLQASLNKA